MSASQKIDTKFLYRTSIKDIVKLFQSFLLNQTHTMSEENILSAELAKPINDVVKSLWSRPSTRDGYTIILISSDQECNNLKKTENINIVETSHVNTITRKYKWIYEFNTFSPIAREFNKLSSDYQGLQTVSYWNTVLIHWKALKATVL